MHVTAEVLLDKVRRENFVSGGHGSVRREASPGFDGLSSGGEVDLVLLHKDADSFEIAERGMAFIEMAHCRPFAEGAQRPQPTDTEYDLLPKAHLFITAIELGGNLAIIGVVLRNIAIEEIEGHAADLDPPDPSLHRPTRQRDRHEHWAALGAGLANERQIEKVIFRI